MRKLAISGLLILPFGVLAACTPAAEPIVGLAVRDGRPIAVLVTCPGRTAYLSVYRDDDEPATGNAHVQWSVSGKPATEVVEVPLLGPAPHGWQVHPPRDLTASESGMDVDIEPLTELLPAVRYSVSGSSSRKAVPVNFSSADYPRIGPDEVLTSAGSDETKVMSRDAFVARGRDNCG